ncbi:MAG: hypothetical protein AAGU77_09130 [Bacillota bacterium]
MNADNLLKGRACYGHLGGTLGNRLFQRLLELKWFEREEGAKTAYRLTQEGIEGFARLGVDTMKRGK